MATSGRFSVCPCWESVLFAVFMDNLAFKSSFANISEWEKWGSQREPGGPPGRGPREERRGPGPSYLLLIAGDGAEPGVNSRLWSAVHATACSMSDRYRCCRLLSLPALSPHRTAAASRAGYSSRFGESAVSDRPDPAAGQHADRGQMTDARSER